MTYLVVRVISPQGIDDYSLGATALARARVEMITPTLQAGETVSTHRCPHAETTPPNTVGDTAPVTSPADWYHCRDDPRAQYEEYPPP